MSKLERDVRDVGGSERKANFDRDGFLHIPQFCSGEECEKMLNHMAELIDSWDPEKTTAPVFMAYKKKGEMANAAEDGTGDYFLDSSNRVHFFLEEGAADKSGKLKVPKERALNKVGHALHVLDEVFREYSFSEKVVNLTRELGWVSPVLPQSMYIFKQPEIGGQVTSHQDSEFLYTTPRPTVLGLWLALQDATLENGCLWARPGSHKEPVRRVFARNPKHFNPEPGEKKKGPQMIFERLDKDKSAPVWGWEGKMPKGWKEDGKGLYEVGFEPLPCRAGDLVVIHGQVDHLSLPNYSQKPRQTYQLHLIEGPKAGITWSEKNWLQYPNRAPFPDLVPLRQPAVAGAGSSRL